MGLPAKTRQTFDTQSTGEKQLLNFRQEASRCIHELWPGRSTRSAELRRFPSPTPGPKQVRLVSSKCAWQSGDSAACGCVVQPNGAHGHSAHHAKHNHANQTLQMVPLHRDFGSIKGPQNARLRRAIGLEGQGVGPARPMSSPLVTSPLLYPSS